MAVPVFMTITGYVSAISFQRHKHSLKACYQPFEIIGKRLRFIVPFWGVYILQIALHITVLNEARRWVESFQTEKKEKIEKTN